MMEEQYSFASRIYGVTSYWEAVGWLATQTSRGDSMGRKESKAFGTELE